MVAPTLLCLGALTAGAQVLQYGDRAPDGTLTVSDPGLLIPFGVGQEDQWLNRVEMNVASTGDTPAHTECDLYVVDPDGRRLRHLQLPCSVRSPGQVGKDGTRQWEATASSCYADRWHR